MFSTIEAAINYIKDKLTDFFYTQRFEIDNLYFQAQRNLRTAQETGSDLLEDAKRNFQEIARLRLDYYELYDKLRPLANAFDLDRGLGALPLAVWTAIEIIGGIGAVIFLAELLYKYYLNLQVQRERVKQIQLGLEPIPREAPPIGETISNLTTIAMIGGTIWLVAQLR